MKIRTGFVSNSSTSSFCIFGTWIKGNYDEVFKDRRCPEGLVTESGPPDDYDKGIYIGKSWASVGDNETGAQFKSSICKALKEAGFIQEDSECCTHEEGWYDG